MAVGRSSERSTGCDENLAVPFRWNGGIRVEQSDLLAIVKSGISGLCALHPPPQPGFPAPDSIQKKFNSRLVVPIEDKSRRTLK
jgi:hypothetical protein